MIDDATETEWQLDAFVVATRPALERALVARFGLVDGMDAAADAVEYACAHVDQLAEMDNPAGYLYRVGVSCALRDLRRRHHTLLVAEPVTTDKLVDVDLQRALLRLNPDHRVAILLVHAHGYSYADAAALIDVPVTTIHNYLSRGVARLRRLMEA
ncbi:MAG TPA: RNA polymerase sigma factor [Ilumatobacteraceae bacterium]|nr:RNA polymerase sigma factor [Ilumatobacteraceae bacterium]